MRHSLARSWMIVLVLLGPLHARTRAQEPNVEQPTAAAPALAPEQVAQAEADAALQSPEVMSASELEALGLEVNAGAVDTAFKLSGFTDFTAYFPIKKTVSVSSAGVPSYQSFFVGNVNVYLSKNLNDAFRALTEVRFTYLPNGSPKVEGSRLIYESTPAFDYVENGRTTRWGGIILERVYLEWTLHRLAVVRGGQFLTPYGIWNVDHGSPAYIPVQRPYAITSGFFPERQTGLEMLGRWDAGNETTFGYHLTLSNGTGPISEYRDLDNNKAIGGRLYWEQRSVGFFRLGGSAYYGRDTNTVPSAVLVKDTVQLEETIVSQYDSLGLAADVQFKYRGLHVQAEFTSTQRRWTTQGRVIHDLLLGPAARGFALDSFSWAAYGLIAYQFDWYALTPFVMLEYTRQQRLEIDAILELAWYHIGLDIQPIDAVTFKIEYGHTSYPKPNRFFQTSSDIVQAQAAWAF